MDFTEVKEANKERIVVIDARKDLYPSERIMDAYLDWIATHVRSKMDRKYVYDLFYNVVGCPVKSRIIKDASEILESEFGAKALSKAIERYQSRIKNDENFYFGQRLITSRRSKAREIADLNLTWIKDGEGSNK